MKQQNIENNNTKNNTFIESKQCSLASSRGTTPADQRSITMIDSEDKTSHAIDSYLY